MDAYFIHLGSLALIYILMTLAFNVAVGYSGLLNLGHIGLMAIGAYTSAILVKSTGVPFIAALVIASSVSAFVGALLALPAKKIRGDYYALITLGFLFVVQAVLINWTSLTRGTFGISGIPRPELLQTNTHYFVLLLVVCVLVYVFLDRIMSSPFGRVLEAVRDDEEVAASLGKPVFKMKLIALVLSGAVVGLSGALLAHFVQFISPGTFWLELLVWAIAGMMVGGLASMPGSVLGILLLFLIEDLLRRYLNVSSDLLGPLRLMTFMAILTLVVIFRPKGILGRAQLEQ